MKPEIPAVGIMKTGEFGSSKFYKVVCGCGQPDHDIDFEVEADETGVNVNTYITAKSDYWTQSAKKRYDIDNPWLQEFDWFWKDLVNGIVTRLKITWTVWTKGYVQVESTIAMNEQQAINYAETVKSAVKDVLQFRKENMKKSSTLKLAEQGDCI